MDLERFGPKFEERLGIANKQIKEWLLDGTIVFDEAMGLMFETDAKSIAVRMSSIESMRDSYLKHPEDPIRGDCRIIAASLVGKLLGNALADEAEVVVDKHFGHYAIVGTINEQPVLFDIARRRPIEVAIPVNEDPVYSDFYDDIPEQVYYAVEIDGNIFFTISDISGCTRRQHEYEKLESESDDLSTMHAILKNHTRLTKAQFDKDGIYQRKVAQTSYAVQVRQQINEILQSGSKDLTIRID